MSGIVGQADQYGIFDNTPRPERIAREFPAEIVSEYTRGPRIGAGQLNPRGVRRQAASGYVNGIPVDDTSRYQPGAVRDRDVPDARSERYKEIWGPQDKRPASRRQAVETWGMDPESHAYHEMPHHQPDPREGWERNEGGRWEPPGYVERAEEKADEGIGQDDLSGYNWGPEPGFEPGAESGPHPDFRGDRPHPMGTPVYRPGGGYGDRPPSFSAARRHTADDGPGPGPISMMDQGGLGEFQGDLGRDLFTPMYFRERAPDSWAMMLGASKTSGVVFQHGLIPGHRVGLPYQNSVIPGTVTHLQPDAQVGVRWDDGQHSVESPGDIYRL